MSRRMLAAVLTLGFLAACSDDDDPTGPSNPPPAGVAVAANSATSATVSFSAVRNATGYVVQRAMGATGGAFEVLDTVTATTFTDSGLQPGTTYRYQVASIVGGSMGAWSAEQAVTTLQAGRAMVTITGDITADRTFYADTVYRLQGFIKVLAPATLTIQPGTRVEGDFNTLGSSLFVFPGARIRAVGTAANPIVFTSSRPAGQREPGDWGGLILLGRGVVNRTSPVILEGSENLTDPRSNTLGFNYAGGTDNADSSGELQYVRIEFAGYATAPNAELNALTLAAVGSGTTISHVQTLRGLDDSFEWFGGAVDAKYLVSYESGDDHFDASEGYVGRVQHMIALQSEVLVPRPAAGNISSDPQGIENDGCGGGASCPQGFNSTPLNQPMFANFTLVGTGNLDSSSGGIGMVLRRGTGGYYVNGVVTRWARAGVSLRDPETQARATAGDLVIRNLMLAQNGTSFEAGSGRFTIDAAANAIETVDATAASLFTRLVADPQTTADLDWSLTANAAARTGGTGAFSGALATRAGTFVTGTSYRGAVDPAATTRWWDGWTRYSVN